MELIATSIRIAAKPQKVLRAVTTTEGHRAWWTEDCEVPSSPGKEAVFRFDSHEATFRIDRLDDRGIEMTCVRNMGQADWQGTRLSIRVVPDGKGSYVDLLHDGYPARTDFFEMCVTGWTHYLRSLQSYCETGRGDPYGNKRHRRAATRT